MNIRDALQAERAELIAKNVAATSWGAAVGARSERIKGIDRELRLLDQRDAPALDPLSMLLDAATFIERANPKWAAAARKAVATSRAAAQLPQDGGGEAR